MTVTVSPLTGASDLGGGTFDVSVIRVDSEGVRILVTGGNPFDLGLQIEALGQSYPA
jgi:hypothetical protein